MNSARSSSNHEAQESVRAMIRNEMKMETVFILYKPAVPGNVGSAARALKTMGFSELRLIRPCDHLSDEARMMAHGSNDILEKAGVFDQFSDAIQDIDLLIGTTAKRRTGREDYYSPAGAHRMVEEKRSSVGRVGIVFGTEESGLPNAVLRTCDIASTIPLDHPYPSLNLSQAVMLYAYQFSDLHLQEKRPEIIAAESYRALKERVKILLEKAGIPKEMPLYPRILERLPLLDTTDIHLLHSVSNRLLEKLEKS